MLYIPVLRIRLRSHNGVGGSFILPACGLKPGKAHVDSLGVENSAKKMANIILYPSLNARLIRDEDLFVTQVAGSEVELDGRSGGFEATYLTSGPIIGEHSMSHLCPFQTCRRKTV
jgi:hypothetical protein